MRNREYESQPHRAQRLECVRLTAAFGRTVGIESPSGTGATEVVEFVALRQTLPAPQAPCGTAMPHRFKQPVTVKLHPLKYRLLRQPQSQRDGVQQRKLWVHLDTVLKSRFAEPLRLRRRAGFPAAL